MVSRELRNKKIQIGKFREWDRENAEVEKRLMNNAVHHKQASRQANKEREEAVNSKKLKIGMRVTDGFNLGKITYIDPKTFAIFLNTGTKEVKVSPCSLSLL